MTTEEEQVGEQAPGYVRALQIEPPPRDCDHLRGECICDDNGTAAANPPEAS